MMIATAIVVGFFVITASAALLSYYGTIETRADVQQSVVLSDDDGATWLNYNQPISYQFDGMGGDCEIVDYLIKNRASVEAPLDITTAFNTYGKGSAGVDVTYYKYAGYSFDDTIKGYSFENVEDPVGVDVIVEEVGNWLQWTFTYVDVIQAASVNIDYPNRDTGSEICIHNNDGQDPLHDPGTWLYTNDGEKAYEGNTLVTDLWWVEATGERNVDDTYVIKIHKTQINDCFHWHIVFTPQSGPAYFSNNNGANWNNFIDACLWEELTTPFTLQPGETMPFRIKYCFALNIMSGRYDITTQFVPTTVST